MQPNLTEDNIVTMALVCFVIIFYAVERVLNGTVLQQTIEATMQLATPSPSQMRKFSRMVAASLMLRFTSNLVKVATGLTLALALYKAFADMARLVLPERVLGLVLLISYCSLAAVVGVVIEELREAFKRLLTP
jgi:hypothetical protein